MVARSLFSRVSLEVLNGGDSDRFVGTPTVACVPKIQPATAFEALRNLARPAATLPD